MIIFPVTRVYGTRYLEGVYVLCSLSHMLSPLVDKFTPFDSLSSMIVTLLVYSAGASGFAAANGSMMIEVVVSQTDPLTA